MAGRTWVAKLIEDLLSINLHQVDVLNKEPQVFIKGRCIDGVDDGHEGSPILVIELDGFFLEFPFAQLIHEASLVDSLFPTALQLGFFFGDESLSFPFRTLEHPKSPFLGVDLQICEEP